MLSIPYTNFDFLSNQKNFNLTTKANTFYNFVGIETYLTDQMLTFSACHCHGHSCLMWRFNINFVDMVWHTIGSFFIWCPWSRISLWLSRLKWCLCKCLRPINQVFLKMAVRKLVKIGMMCPAKYFQIRYVF